MRAIIAEEEEHEARLMQMVDEERLHYVGSIVLGLNDALVELTGTIAGLTFALASNRLVALSGIITGVSATLSMAASNYLAQRAEGNPKALKSSAYTGIAYLLTVILIVLPYLLLPNDWYVAAFAIMICRSNPRHTYIQLLYFRCAGNAVLEALWRNGAHQPWRCCAFRSASVLRQKPCSASTLPELSGNSFSRPPDSRRVFNLAEFSFVFCN